MRNDLTLGLQDQDKLMKIQFPSVSYTVCLARPTHVLARDPRGPHSRQAYGRTQVYCSRHPVCSARLDSARSQDNTVLQSAFCPRPQEERPPKAQWPKPKYSEVPDVELRRICLFNLLNRGLQG